MTQPNRTFCFGTFVAVLVVALFPSTGHAGTWVAFGPKTYTRGTGAPVTVTDTFTLLNPATTYTLKVFNGGLQDNQTELVSNSIVILNGVQVIGPNNFNQNVAEVNVPIYPQVSNTLSVQVRGQPGGVLAIEVVGVDNDPPTITASVSPSPNAAGWNNSPVTITFTCSDKTSGVASCPSPITVNTEGANQVFSGTATDLAGNTASTSVTINLDMTPPTITGSINPPPDAGGYNSGPVTVSFTCADALSGVASCSPSVSITTEVTNHPVTGTAVDIAGNTAGTTVTVNISSNYFLARNYAGKCLDYGTPQPGSGATVFLNDCSSAHPIRVEEFDTTTHQVLLHAGSQVIAIHNPPANSLGGAPPPIGTQYVLELQIPWYAQRTTFLTGPENQIFSLDGDSIILESSRPCFHVDTTNPDGSIGTSYISRKDGGPCPNPLSPNPPQLVIQIQNSRGANGSSLEVNLRNLSDNEFWDFVAIDGSGKPPASGFKAVATNDGLWNEICSSPQVQTGVDPPISVDDNMPLSVPCSQFKAGWNRVIVVTSPKDCGHVAGPAPGQTQDIGGCIDLTHYPPIVLPAGTTLRGDRRGTNFGPQLYMSLLLPRPAVPGVCINCALVTRGDYVRITGLRLRGQSRSTSTSVDGIDGIWVEPQAADLASPSGLASTTALVTIIDHNDVSDWTGTAIGVHAPYDFNNKTNTCLTTVNRVSTPNFSVPCSTSVSDPTNPSAGSNVSITSDPATLANARVERNFVHHNARDNLGYGVGGGRLLISGNTFVSNRHSIASDGEPHAEYRASYNLVLSTSATGDQDFDMHGTNGGYGGVAGYYVDILSNTFLGTGHSNYWLRGFPSVNTDFHRNISLQGQGSAVEFKSCSPLSICLGGPTPPINIFDQVFGSSADDPTTRLGPASFGVGDFDNDGLDDLFLTTGAAWYFSPGGARDWRFLSAKTDRIDTLLLGDFDGDGRTDVVGMNTRGQFDVSWGGVSDWEVINAAPCANGVPATCPTSIQNMVVGDFDGDGTPDIFYADKVHWYISYGGTKPFTQVNDSSFLVSALRFGHFSVCGNGTETDVFGIVSGKWMVSCGALGTWIPLPASLTTSVDGLIIADFSGTGNADVGMSCFGLTSPGCWQISAGGTQNWQQYTIGSWDRDLAAVGHFLGRVDASGNPIPADLLFWNTTPPIAVVAMCDSSVGVNTELCLSVGGKNQSYRYTSQDMR